jgi:hypothetical protein
MVRSKCTLPEGPGSRSLLDNLWCTLFRDPLMQREPTPMNIGDVHPSSVPEPAGDGVLNMPDDADQPLEAVEPAPDSGDHAVVRGKA